MGGFAWVTLATNDSYSLGALVLAHSLKQVGTNHQLVVLVTPGVTNAMKEKLSSVFNLVQEVNILDSKDEANLRLLKRPELGVTFTKLHCWRLTQFDKCVFLDADTLVLKNCDELFDREELSAAPDVGWPDCFNSGVFVYRPSNATYENLVQLALDKGSFDGGDQGLLNLYFSDWATKDISKHLPFIYNLCSTACYSYLPAFKQFGGDAKIIHFIGTSKPWLQYFNTETRKVQPTPDLKHLEAILQHWWNIFCSLIHPRLSPEMARSSSDVTHTSISSRTSRDHDKPQPDSIKNEIWDPWEEYDQKHSSFVPQTESLPPSNPEQNFPPTNQTHSNFVDAHQTRTLYTHQTHPTPYPHQVNEPSQIKPIESHNTNACYNASQEHNPPSVPEQPERSQPFSFRENSQHKNFSDDDRPHPSPPPPPPPLSFDDRPKYVAPPPVSNTFHVPQASPGPFHSSQDSPVQSELVTPKPAEQTFPVPPNECEAAATVCKETTLHTPSCEDSTASGLAGAFAQLTLGAPRTAEQSALDDHLRRQGWEVGNIDYMGRDSFDNIWSKICETLSAGLPAEASKTTEATPPSTDEKPIEKTVTEASVKLPEQEVPPPVPAPQDTATDTSVAPSETPKTVSEVSQSISLEQPALVSPPQQETIRTEPSPAPPTSDAPPKSQQEASPAAEPLQCPIPTKPKEPTAAEPQVPVPPTPKEEAPAEGPQCPVPPKPKEPALLECSLPPKTQDASVKAVSDAPVTPDSAQVPSEAAKPAVATEQTSQAAPAPQEVAPPAAQETVAPTAPPETVVPSQTPPAPAQEVPKATTPAEVTPPPQAATPTEVGALPQPVAPAEAPAPPQAATPAEVAAPPQAATPAEVAAPPEATKPAEIAAPPQAATPAEAPVPPEAVKSSEVAAPPQASTPAEAAAPPQKATPAEIAAPAQAVTPAEAPAPQATTPAVAPAPQATTPAEAPGPKATAPPETTKSAESAPTQTPPAEAAAPPKDAASTPAQEAQPAPQEKGAVSVSAVPPTETAQPTSPVSSTPQPEPEQVAPATTQVSATPKAETTPSTPTSEGPKTKSEQSKQAKQEAAQSATSATSPTPPPRKGTGPGKKSKAKK